MSGGQALGFPGTWRLVVTGQSSTGKLAKAMIWLHIRLYRQGACCLSRSCFAIMLVVPRPHNACCRQMDGLPDVVVRSVGESCNANRNWSEPEFPDEPDIYEPYDFRVTMKVCLFCHMFLPVAWRGVGASMVCDHQILWEPCRQCSTLGCLRLPKMPMCWIAMLRLFSGMTYTPGCLRRHG